MKNLRRALTGLALLALASMKCLPASAACTVAVEPFANSTGYYVPAEAVTDMIVTELVNSGAFQVVERQRLGAVAREQRMGMSGLMDESSAPRAGRLKGAQYTITGAVTQYGRGGGAAGGVVGNWHNRTGIALGTKKATVTLDVRIIDNTTGAIVYAGRESGSASSVSVGILSRYAGFGTGQSSGILASACRQAVIRVVNQLRRASGAGAAPGGGQELHVLEHRGSHDVLIDAGSSSGAQKGRYFAVYRESDAVKDLRGNVLDVRRYYLAVLQVVDAKPNYSRCKIVKGGGFQRGDLIEPVNRPSSVALGYE